MALDLGPVCSGSSPRGREAKVKEEFGTEQHQAETVLVLPRALKVASKGKRFVLFCFVSLQHAEVPGPGVELTPASAVT